MSQIDVRTGQIDDLADPVLDEVVASDADVHLECTSDYMESADDPHAAWWLRISAGGREVDVTLWAKAPIEARVEDTSTGVILAERHQGPNPASAAACRNALDDIYSNLVELEASLSDRFSLPDGHPLREKAAAECRLLGRAIEACKHQKQPEFSAKFEPGQGRRAR